MEYLVRFIQTHESFRKPETEAIAAANGIEIQWSEYSDDSPFALIRFPSNVDSATAARTLSARSILSAAIYELWGCGTDHSSLHQDVRSRTESLWPQYKDVSFRFTLDCFRGRRSTDEQREIIESFDYMHFQGPIVMSTPEYSFRVFENYNLDAKTPKRVYFGRLVAESGRKAMTRYDLKKRSYISTTSMDAELSLITANMALAAPGKLIYDPFMGTGSFPLACAHFGATVLGSDMDGRSIRGKKGRNVKGNFTQYGTLSFYVDGFISDLTNTPLRRTRCIDGIVCDPPYGVREGLKVLGSTREDLQKEVILVNGVPAHLQEGYIPPKRPYSFLWMLDDILDFASGMLVDEGRLCMWMPVAAVAEGTTVMDDTPELQKEYAIPQHPALENISVCKQDFTKWSRCLLTYRRLPTSAVPQAAVAAHRQRRLERDQTNSGGTADDLNDFRRKYFQGFKGPG